MNLFEQLKNFLDRENIYFLERVGTNPSVNIKIEGRFSILFVTIYFIESKNTLICQTDFPVKIPTRKRNEILELISVLNNNSLITNFVLDGNNFLKVKSSLFSCESKIESETFKRLIFINLNAVENHFKKILAVAQINFPINNVTQSEVNLN